VDLALRRGNRGLPGGNSLARLLAARRGVRNRAALGRLTTAKILDWADAYHDRTGSWPTRTCGLIIGEPGESWWAIDHALKLGTRGLRGGSSLAQLLLDRRGVRSIHTVPLLTVEKILGWAKAHYRRTGHWPTSLSGPIPGSHGDTWKGIDYALRIGRRGLAGGSSVAKLLAEQGWKINSHSQTDLSYTRILRWADIHYEETGSWPHAASGRVHHTRHEFWDRVDIALRKGKRGLPGGSSLAQLLAARRGVRNPAKLPPLTIEQILAWADAHHQRTGDWPRMRSGPIAGAPGETWRRVNSALMDGSRSLGGSTTLARLLADHRGVPNVKALPKMTTGQIVTWARAQRLRTGAWPTIHSGPILEEPAETWKNVDHAMRRGYRGFPGGSSLHRFLATIEA
jgi:hypothetical protein